MSDDTKKKPKAIAMISGGLDSSIALHHVKQLGFDVKAVNFYTGFCITETHRRIGGRPKDGSIPKNEPLHAAAEAETEVEFVDVSDEYVDVVTNPKYGYGANMNPCVDCRIFMMKKAKEIMEEEGAEFVFTGEVLGQRPKSQRRDTLRIIERESGLEGRLLRPLSGKFLPPTRAEEAGLIRREDLLDLKGRGRKEQIRIADEMGLLDYPQPAGGCCFLTDESYSKRFKDLIDHKADRRYTKDDIVLLSAGRHFRLGPSEKLIVSRTEGENALLERYRDGRWHVEAVGFLGPAALCEGEPDETARRLASQIVARYGKGKDAPEVTVRWTRGDARQDLTVPTLKDDAGLEPFRV
jgi:tRNA-uridine 2-sulfurtransferase